MHNHPKDVCEHELKYCADCDAVYCEKCNSEWKKEKPLSDRVIERLIEQPGITPTPAPYRPGLNEVWCAHDNCPQCKMGTCNGIHMISCSCKKCKPSITC